MTALVLTAENLKAVKNGLRGNFPEIRSCHADEALAAALGRRTYAALMADVRAMDPADPEIALLDDNAFLDRAAEFGFEPSDEDRRFGFFHEIGLQADGQVLVETYDCRMGERAYKTVRQRAWRNAMVAAVNAGIKQKAFSVRPGDNRWPGGREARYQYRFTFPGGVPGLASVGDASFDELSVHVALYPRPDGERWIECSNGEFLAGDVFANGWLERREGAWLQHSPDLFKCRKRCLEAVASAQVQPKGYGDIGRVMW